MRISTVSVDIRRAPDDFPVLVVRDIGKSGKTADVIRKSDIGSQSRKDGSYLIPEGAVADLKIQGAGEYAYIPSGIGYQIATIQVENLSPSKQKIKLTLNPDRSTWIGWYTSEKNKFTPERFCRFDRNQVLKAAIHAFLANSILWFAGIFLYYRRARRR